MARKILIVSSDDPYHLSARTNNRDWFALPMEVVWRIMTDYLFFIHHAYSVEIFSFVLMDNHFHLIARFPSGELPQAMLYFMRETSRSIAKASGRINHVYGARYYRSQIQTTHYFNHAYKYVYRNPVESQIVPSVELYQYSTLSGLLGAVPIYIPIVEDVRLFSDSAVQTLGWLNREVSKENREAVRLALRRDVFKFPLERGSRRPNVLETSLY